MLVLLLVLFLLVSWVVGLVDSRVATALPVQQQCRVQVDGTRHQLTLEQSQNTAIIVAEAQRRRLPARAASIALATAMQESDLRNIDYGDRDSIGLFQQRPSQGWGSVEQIMDPWYSAGKFYEHLVKVPGWQSGDINDVAQQVQRSGVPDGYRKHEAAAKAWGSALTGHSPAAVGCLDRSSEVHTSAEATRMLQRAFGSRVSTSQAQAMVTLNAPSSTDLWSATQLFMLTTGSSGVSQVQVGSQSWVARTDEVAGWQGEPQPNPTEAVVTLRA